MIEKPRRAPRGGPADGCRGPLQASGQPLYIYIYIYIYVYIVVVRLLLLLFIIITPRVRARAASSETLRCDVGIATCRTPRCKLQRRQ